MTSPDRKTFERKSTTLGINRIADEVTVLSIAQAMASAASQIKEIKIITVKSGSYRNALIDFNTVEQCESAKNTFSVLKIAGVEYPLHFARSQDSSPFNMVASENKLYVKYPQESNEDEIIRMLGDVQIKKSEDEKNYFFATCKDIEQQCRLIKNFNKAPVTGGELVVKVAIDRTRKVKAGMRKVAAN
jgi:hypothetical protein